MFGPVVATIINRGWDGTTKDRHGNKVVANLDWYTLPGCRIDQRSSAEDLDRRDTVPTDFVLITPAIPPGRTIGPLDRVQLPAAQAGVVGDHGPDYYYADVATFDIDGNPDQLTLLDGTVHHMELYLRRVKL